MVAPPRKNDFEIYVSQLGVQEAEAGDVEAATCRLEALENIPLLDILDDAVRLAEKLVEQKAIPEKASEDISSCCPCGSSWNGIFAYVEL